MKGQRGRKKSSGGEKGQRGEDFPGKFGKPPDRQIRQGPTSPKTRDHHPFGGDHLPLPPPCLRPYVEFGGAFKLIILSLIKNKELASVLLVKNVLILVLYCYTCKYVWLRVCIIIVILVIVTLLSLILFDLKFSSQILICVLCSFHMGREVSK